MDAAGIGITKTTVVGGGALSGVVVESPSPTSSTEESVGAGSALSVRSTRSVRNDVSETVGTVAVVVRVVLGAGAAGVASVAVALEAPAASDVTGALSREIPPPHPATANADNTSATRAARVAGLEATLRDNEDKLPFDYAKDNDHLRGSDVYWRLNDARF